MSMSATPRVKNMSREALVGLVRDLTAENLELLAKVQKADANEKAPSPFAPPVQDTPTPVLPALPAPPVKIEAEAKPQTAYEAELLAEIRSLRACIDALRHSIVQWDGGQAPVAAKPVEGLRPVQGSKPWEAAR